MLLRSYLRPTKAAFLSTYMRLHNVTCSSVCFSTIPVLPNLYYCCKSGAARLLPVCSSRCVVDLLLKIILNVKFSLNMMSCTNCARISLFCSPIYETENKCFQPGSQKRCILFLPIFCWQVQTRLQTFISSLQQKTSEIEILAVSILAKAFISDL